ncbi:raffinose/stachyose/melibiose transport system substrate-binding protein [Humibacillus xanthopallidus]|uniref:Raffinose/stachyose/melibiose transport system substrate-binding protein n=1 Tax=Humibacillus xanthopallidus TaxID=412689 RepID=A0A543PPC3_9MICO|nr:extracellular solute-binding protein [Humibacillus xanthopallidus]TQN45921.1 raffinose/stachyose/melibiose transport system substrate-binding protein [Humibacillus xanthopallidus]
MTFSFPRVALAAVAVGVLALSACSGDATGAGAGSSAEDTGATTLKLWHYESANGAMGAAWDKAIEIFKKEHPGVTVEFERKAFEQIQQNAGMILNSTEGPDLMEYNKGNATAGLLASQGLLTDLTAEAQKRGWDKKLSPSLQTTAKYDDKGVMGGNTWYGVPNYGEYVMVYYNKDLFTKNGVALPKTFAELESALAAFKAKGIAGLGMSGAEYPAGQLYYQLALSKADRSFVNNYQLYKGPVDFKADPLKYGAETFDSWVKAGYIAKDTASAKAEDMGTAFIAGKTPMIVSGSWWFGRFNDEIKGFDWGTMLFPGNTLNAGSSGNLWVVPTNSKAKSLAYDFIDITMRPEVQNILGEKGGLPVAGDPSQIKDPRTRQMTENFATLLKQDGLAFYPDWPVPGYYDVIVSSLQGLINQSKDPSAVLASLEKPYQDGVKEMQSK